MLRLRFSLPTCNSVHFSNIIEKKYNCLLPSCFQFGQFSLLQQHEHTFTQFIEILVIYDINSLNTHSLENVNLETNFFSFRCHTLCHPIDRRPAWDCTFAPCSIQSTPIPWKTHIRLFSLFRVLRRLTWSIDPYGSSYNRRVSCIPCHLNSVPNAISWDLVSVSLIEIESENLEKIQCAALFLGSETLNRAYFHWNRAIGQISGAVEWRHFVWHNQKGSQIGRIRRDHDQCEEPPAVISNRKSLRTFRLLH